MLHHTIRGKRYRIVSRKLGPRIGGKCEAPDARAKTISICETLKGNRRVLANLLHESMHAAFWDMGEEAIDSAAEDIARLLIRCGVTLDVTEVHRRLRMDSDPT